MSERLRFIISGFFVGLAELLPGISGSTVAIAFNVYEKFILFLSNLKISNFSFSLKKLNQVFFLDLIIPFFIAMALSIIESVIQFGNSVEAKIEKSSCLYEANKKSDALEVLESIDREKLNDQQKVKFDAILKEILNRMGNSRRPTAPFNNQDRGNRPPPTLDKEGNVQPHPPY